MIAQFDFAAGFARFAASAGFVAACLGDPGLASPAFADGFIMPGDRATIITGRGAPIDAAVRSVTPTVAGATQAATVVLIPTSGAGQFIAGEGVQVRIRVRGDHGAGGLTVPEDAVQNIDGRDILFVRTATGFVARPVLVGTRSGGIAQIVSGIRAGEQVATRNAFLVKADMIKSAGEEEE